MNPERLRLALLASLLGLQPAACASPPAATPPQAQAPSPLATPEASPPPASRPTPPPTPGPSVAPTLHFGAITEHEQATDAELALAPNGTYHVVYRALEPGSGRQALYYRASADRGASWSAPERLSEAGTSIEVGAIGVAVEGSGRVFVLWTALDPTTGGREGGTLLYRLRSPGGWEAPVAVGRSQAVKSWFASRDPLGTLHLVWGEARGTIGPGGADQVLRLRLGQEGEPETIFTAERGTRSDGVPTLDGLEGLQGRIDDQGRVHFLAQLTPGGGGPRVIVHHNGQALTEVAEVTDFTFWHSTFTDNPPQLLVDARNQDHMLIVNERSDWLQVLDYPLGQTGEPAVIAKTALGGQLRALRGVQGPDGQMAALMTIKASDKPEDAFDLYVSTYGDGQWTVPVDATVNDRHAEPGQAAYQLGTRFQAGAAAGRFRAGGKLDLIYLNTEQATSGEHATVYFKQLP